MGQCWKKFATYIMIGISITLFTNTMYAIPSLEGIQIYQKNIHQSEEHKQILAEDIDRYHNADNMWSALRSEFILPHYESNPAVQYEIQWFMNHQDFLLHSANRAAPYMYYIFQQVKKRHLPTELVLLPMIESAYNPFAYSTAGAAGIWQMMPGTASGYGIKQNWWYDGRRDVVASTQAALNHLSYLSSFFQGNWLLALAAYDTGEGNVLAAIRKNINAGSDVDFWSLPLSQETREYVPRLLALAAIISHPWRYPVPFPFLPNAPYLAQIDIGEQISLTQAADLAGLTLEKLKHLNPGYSRNKTDPNGPFKVVLPIENVVQFTENLSLVPDYHPLHHRYKIKSGDTVFSLAKRFNTTPAMLAKNNPQLNAKLKPGIHVTIPIASRTPPISKMIMESESTKQTHTLTASIANSFKKHKKYKLHPGDTLYIVRNNDDIHRISRHFHINPNAIIAINHLDATRSLTPGTSLMIPTHAVTTAQHIQLTPGDTIYMVRPGDTIEKIAQRFHATPTEIRLANLLASNTLHEGDRLVIPTHGFVS